MFVVLLKFSKQKDLVSQFLEAHKKWIKHGFDDGVFLLAGSLQPGLGGSIIAHNVSHSALQTRLDKDPFVQENIVTAEILEIEPSITDARLAFLQD